MPFPNGTHRTGRHVAGVDLGGSYTRVLLADEAGTEIASAARPTPRDDAGRVIALIVDLCRELAAESGIGWDQVGRIGLGVPGVADRESGALHLAPNLPPFDGVDLAGALREALRVTVAIDNDVNAATLAEHRHGLGADLDDFAFIAVGTGVGMGIVAGGRLQRGATGAAGEIAWLPLGGDPFSPVNHVRGTLEEAAGGAAVARRYAERTGADPSEPMDLFALAATGDREAEAALDHQARSLALAVAAVQSVLDPALVVFGGGIGTRPELLAAIRGHLARLTHRPLSIEASSLGEQAGVLGAIELARDTDPQPTEAER